MTALRGGVTFYSADVAALRDDVVGIDGNLTTAASVTVVEAAVTGAIDDLDELGELAACDGRLAWAYVV